MASAGASKEAKAKTIRRAAPLILAMVANYERRLEQERAASSPATQRQPRVTDGTRGDLERRAS